MVKFSSMLLQAAKWWTLILCMECVPAPGLLQDNTVSNGLQKEFLHLDSQPTIKAANPAHPQWLSYSLLRLCFSSYLLDSHPP